MNKLEKLGRKRRLFRYGFLVFGIILGALAMVSYLYPAFFTDHLGTLTNINKPEIRGVAKATNGWDEKWTIEKYRTVEVYKSTSGGGRAWYNRDMAIGPAEMKVLGTVNNSGFEETWTAGNWNDSSTDSDTRGKFLSGFDGVHYEFSNMVEAEKDYVYAETGSGGKRRIIMPTGGYGFFNFTWTVYEQLRSWHGHFDAGVSWPQSWHVEGKFTN